MFPRIPLLRIEGNLAVGQLLETPLLNLLNYASLITTNATRFKRAAGPDKSLLEFGLRRAQGPDGGLSASRYSYMAGFAGTSNVLAGKLHNIPIKGTHAHAFVQAHTSLDDVKVRRCFCMDFFPQVAANARCAFASWGAGFHLGWPQFLGNRTEVSPRVGIHAHERCKS